jgi:hypothetical protein
MILVLGVVEELLPFTEELLLVETALLVEELPALLPDTALLRLLLLDELLPERLAMDEPDLLPAELLL